MFAAGRELDQRQGALDVKDGRSVVESGADPVKDGRSLVEGGPSPV